MDWLQRSTATDAAIMAYIRQHQRGRDAGAVLAAIVRRFGDQPDWTQDRVAELIEQFAILRARKPRRSRKPKSP